MLCESSNYCSFCFKEQSHTSLGYVIITIHRNFRKFNCRKAGVMRNERRKGNVIRTWSNYALRVCMVLFNCFFFWKGGFYILFFFFSLVSCLFPPLWSVFISYWPGTWPLTSTLSWLTRFNIYHWLAIVCCILGQVQKGVRKVPACFSLSL